MSLDSVITIVSGLPRSGTSMMMKMLQAGGLEPVTDGIRRADEDNPKGYFEFERVKKIKEDKAWLPEAQGKVVKMIAQLLLDLPMTYRYKVIFMRRNIEEILASQRQMMVRRGTVKEGGPSDEEMGRMLLKHLDQVMDWAAKQDAIESLSVNYNDMLTSPQADIARVNDLLGGGLDTSAMAAVIDKNLYRQRKA